MRALASRAGLAQDDPAVLDLEIKRTRVFEDSFFSNVVMRNFRSYPETPPTHEAQAMPLGRALQRGVSISVDFNDRFAFNERHEYRSSVADAQAVLNGALAASREATRLFVSPS